MQNDFKHASKLHFKPPRRNCDTAARTALETNWCWMYDLQN